MSDNIKVLTVGRGWNGYKQVPTIRLRGEWLKIFGYDEGQKLQVVYSFENETLTLIKCATPHTTI